MKHSIDSSVGKLSNRDRVADMDVNTSEIVLQDSTSLQQFLKQNGALSVNNM